MNNERADRLIREKTDGLDALAGGIVFGKDEAWEKLQARMDEKPRRSVALRYWLAAAAVLLLLVCGITFYRQPQTGLAHNPLPVLVEEPKAPSIFAETSQASSAMTNQSVNGHMDKTIAPPNINRQEEIKIAISPIAKDTPAIMPAFIEDKELKNEVATVRPQTVEHHTSVPMKVVHINQLETGAPAEKNSSGLPAYPLDLSRLPVVHVNKVGNAEFDVESITEQNKARLVHNLFWPRGYNDDNSNEEEKSQPRNFLKTVLNTQN